jgi:MarC family membrane protein
MDVPILWNFVITSFALMNPLGMVPIFITFTARERKDVQRLVALFVAITVLGLLLIFMFLGTPILHFFGISLDAFRIAGGILLLGIGINIVNGVEVNPTRTLIDKGSEKGIWTAAQSVYRQIVIPMALPLLVGPGVIANVILYANEIEARKQDLLNLELIGGTILLSLAVLLIFAAAKWLQSVLGEVGLSILQRVMGLFVAAMGVQFVVTGAVNIILKQLAPAFRT